MGFSSKSELVAFVEGLMGGWGSKEFAERVIQKLDLDWTTADKETLSDDIGPIELVIGEQGNG